MRLLYKIKSILYCRLQKKKLLDTKHTAIIGYFENALQGLNFAYDL